MYLVGKKKWGNVTSRWTACGYEDRGGRGKWEGWQAVATFGKLKRLFGETGYSYRGIRKNQLMFVYKVVRDE